MSNSVEVMIITEGKTERDFVTKVLAPEVASRGIYLHPAVLKKRGQNGGDVRFDRVKNDIGLFLKQRKSTYVSMLIDFYGIGSWIDLDKARNQPTTALKAELFNNITYNGIIEAYSDHRAAERFIPYVSMHEFEALLFSNAEVLAKKLGVNISAINSILDTYDSPEDINNSQVTAPSKRLKNLSSSFNKVSTGIDIAKTIGIGEMRDNCPLFNAWVTKLESLTEI